MLCLCIMLTAYTLYSHNFCKHYSFKSVLLFVLFGGYTSYDCNIIFVLVFDFAKSGFVKPQFSGIYW